MPPRAMPDIFRKAEAACHHDSSPMLLVNAQVKKVNLSRKTCPVLHVARSLLFLPYPKWIRSDHLFQCQHNLSFLSRPFCEYDMSLDVDHLRIISKHFVCRTPIPLVNRSTSTPSGLDKSHANRCKNLICSWTTASSWRNHPPNDLL